MTMETRITSLIVLPEGEPIFSERATIVRIEDEAGGEYIVVDQDSIPGRGNVAINPEEWPDIRDAIERMMKECRPINALDQGPGGSSPGPAGAMGYTAGD